MKLSIIIVNYNVKHFLDQCLTSVRRAITGLDADIWVVDNNSVDGSVRMVKQKFPESIEWTPYGLPSDFLPLLASARAAFVKEDDGIVGHGGISLEEAIVPLVEVRWKGK